MKASADALVSVVVPVYNSQKTLHLTMESIGNQTYPHLEIILIDDKSTDGSSELIEKYGSDLQGNFETEVRIITHAQNKGVAAARNSGLNAATGEYIYFLDADDWIEPDAIELMMKEAVITEADIIGINWWLSFDRNERKMKQPEFVNTTQAIEWMMIGKMRWNLWMFLVKRDLYEVNSIRFVPGKDMGEDMIVMIKLFSYAEKVFHLNRALYHYGQSNTRSLTKVYSDKHVEDVTYNVRELESFLLNSKFGAKYKPLINCLKLNIKLPLLISNKNSQYDRWRSWFSEANDSVTSNRDISLRIRLLQWAAVHQQDWLLKLHYYLVIRLVYGVIYK